MVTERQKKKADSNPAKPSPAAAALSSVDTKVYIQLFWDYVDKADDFLLQWHVVEQVQTSTGIRAVYLIPCIMAVLLLLFGWFDHVITNAVGFFYPAWQSFKAIETKAPDDDKQWLTYWVVFAAFSIFEMFSSVLLFWVPFYYILKIVFLLWLLLPQFQGAKFVYNRAIRPILNAQRDRIDGIVNRIQEQADQMRDNVDAGIRKRANASSFHPSDD